jgi:hypothetical protein
MPPCPHCSFDIDHLIGVGLTPFQQEKWNEHRELLYGGTLTLHGKPYNASFNHNGEAKIELLTRFVISYGHEGNLPSPHGGYINAVRVAYVPEIVGSGASVETVDNVPVSGLCIISPQSVEFGHSFPAMTSWVSGTFGNEPAYCKFCGRPTQFGLVICDACYSNGYNDWTVLL